MTIAEGEVKARQTRAIEERKEWLEGQIEKLTSADLFAPLGKQDKLWLESYQQEYQQILDKEYEQAEAIKTEKSREMRNRRRRGKYGEKKLAKEVGGRRDGGIGHKDVIQGMFSYEVKTLKEIPASVINLMRQAERLKKQDTIAVGVFRCNSPRQEYFIIEKQDWLSLHGKGIK